MRFSLFTKITFAILGSFWFAANARGETLTVSGDGKAGFTSITAAIHAANTGDTIIVQPGLFCEQVILDKTLILEGVDKPIVQGDGRGSVITVTAPNCVIRGFIVRHCGSELQNEDSGILLKSSGNLIEDNNLDDVLFGIYLLQSKNNTINRNTIRGRAALDVGDRGSGLHLYLSPDNTIQDNTIVETRDGMYIQNSAGNTIKRNRVSNLRYGLHYMFSDANKFEENLFSNNTAGAAIMYSNRIEFRRNAFIHNRGYSSFGILFQECNDCIAEANFFVDNAAGLFLEAVRRSTFRNNVLAENDIAVQMFASSEENVFTQNNFIDNLCSLRLIGRSTTTRWSDNGRGNFWGGYDGYDLDADGVGDEPHKLQNVFEFMEGNYPRLRLYLSSPAAQALAAAENTLPVLRGSSEADASPLIAPVYVRFPFADERQTRTTAISLLAVSLTMCGVALAIVLSTRRRPVA